MAKKPVTGLSLKRVIIAAAAALLAAVIAYYVFFKKPDAQKLPPLRTGMAAENIILGYTQGRTYTLHDFTVSKDIVMVFLGASRGSKLLEKALESRVLPGKNTMLITLKTDGTDMTAQIKYGTNPLSYRFPYKNLPLSYKHLKEPGIIILDRTGTIRLIYSGYSPTVFSDISGSLSGASK